MTKVVWSFQVEDPVVRLGWVLFRLEAEDRRSVLNWGMEGQEIWTVKELLCVEVSVDSSHRGCLFFGFRDGAVIWSGCILIIAL